MLLMIFTRGDSLHSLMKVIAGTSSFLSTSQLSGMMMGLRKRSPSNFLEDDGYMLGLGRRKRMPESQGEAFFPVFNLGSRSKYY